MQPCCYYLSFYTSTKPPSHSKYGGVHLWCPHRGRGITAGENNNYFCQFLPLHVGPNLKFCFLFMFCKFILLFCFIYFVVCSFCDAVSGFTRINIISILKVDFHLGICLKTFCIELNFLSQFIIWYLSHCIQNESIFNVTSIKEYCVVTCK